MHRQIQDVELWRSEVSSNGKEMKAEDTQKQRQEIEAETKA